MPLQHINELLGLPELLLNGVLSINTTEVYLEALLVAYKQPCSVYDSKQSVIRDGRNKSRQIRQISIF